MATAARTVFCDAVAAAAAAGGGKAEHGVAAPAAAVADMPLVSCVGVAQTEFQESGNNFLKGCSW